MILSRITFDSACVCVRTPYMTFEIFLKKITKKDKIKLQGSHGNRRWNEIEKKKMREGISYKKKSKSPREILWEEKREDGKSLAVEIANKNSLLCMWLWLWVRIACHEHHWEWRSQKFGINLWIWSSLTHCAKEGGPVYMRLSLQS